MAMSFPQTIKPIGRVTASIDEAVQDIGKLWPIQVVVDVACSELDCGENLGKYSCIFDYILMLSHPKNGQFKSKHYSLSDLIIDRINSHIKKIIREKIRCGLCRGFPEHAGVSRNNLKMPPFLVLNFILAGHTDNHYNDFDDNCVLEPFLEVEGYNLELSCAVLASRMQFFAISKLFGSFYKFDDMIEDSLAAVPYSSFTEAYNEKYMKTVPPFHLNQKSVRPRKGAVYFVIYKGPEYDEEVEERWRKTLGKAECLDKVSNCKISDENDNSEPPPKKSKELNGDNSDVFSETVQEATATEDLGVVLFQPAPVCPSEIII